MPVVYLVHWTATVDRRGLGGHYLAVSAKDDPELPLSLPRGTGRVQTPAGATIADVWPCDDIASAASLYRRLAAQGSRRRLCSICSPGNGRGGGTGNWRAAKQLQGKG